MLGRELVELEIVNLDHAVRRLVGEPQHRRLRFGDDASIHRIDEHIAVADLERLPALYRAVAERLLTPEEPS